MRTSRWLTGMLAGSLAAAGGVGLLASASAQETSVAAGESEGQDAQPRRPIASFLHKHFHRAWEMRSKLGLTEEQKTKIRETFAGKKAEIIDTFKKVKEKRQALRDAVLAEMPSEESIRAAADELGRTIADAAVKASQMAQEFRKNLTAEQLEKIRKFREKQRAEFDKMLDKALGE